MTFRASLIVGGYYILFAQYEHKSGCCETKCSVYFILMHLQAATQATYRSASTGT